MTKQYKHKKLGWMATQDINLWYTINRPSGLVSNPQELIENSDDREEIKTPTHFGNGMTTNDKPGFAIQSMNPPGDSDRYKKAEYYVDDRTIFSTKEQAKAFDEMMQMIYKIRQRHSENGEGCGLYDIFYDGEEWDWNRNKDGQATNFFLPMFSSKEKAQECIDYFGSDLDILLSWYNMQKKKQ